MFFLIFLFFIAFSITFFLAFLFIRFLPKIKYFKFSNLIKQRKQNFIPIIGGVAIYISILFTIILFLHFPNVRVNNLKIFYGILIGSGGILIIGILDDMFEFSPSLKLVGQILTAILPLFFGIYTEIIYFSYSVNLVITVIWIVVIVNAFNFLDILDGLATGVGLIVSLVFLFLGILTGNFVTVLTCLTLVGALSAFLIFNFQPAKIYLGDMGSMCLGFILSLIALNISYAPSGHEFALISPILILGLPIYDFAFVTFRRFFSKRSVFNKSDDHFAFQLMKYGYSQKKTLYVIYVLSIFFGIVAIAITLFENKGSILFFLFCLIIFIVFNKILFSVKKNKIKA